VVGDDGSNRVVGMLKDRDICMATHFRGVPPGALHVGEVMSKAVRTIGPLETPADAKAAMSDSQVRRLPVVDEDERLLGLISLADLARAAVRESASKKKKPEVTEKGVAETLEAICSVRTPRQAAASA
jgi:CBS-domain-containing membrane protein